MASRWAKCVGKYAGNETALAGNKVLPLFSRETIFILSVAHRRKLSFSMLSRQLEGRERPEH